MSYRGLSNEEWKLIETLEQIWTVAEDCNVIGHDDLTLGLKEVFAKGVKQLTDEGAKELSESMKSRGA